jgi:iron complex transport system substrate-binding protein
MNKDNLATGGSGVKVLSPPERIVSLTPSASELICLLGGMDKIVGRDDHSSFPPGLDGKPALGSGVRKTIRVGEVLDLNPDVVVAGRWLPPETFEKIESAGVPVVIVGTSCEMESLISNVQALGEMVDSREKAEELVDFIQRYVNLVLSRTRGLEIDDKPRVYHECAFGKYKTTGAGTAADLCIALAGGMNIACDEGANIACDEAPAKSVVRGDWVAENNPDIIISQVSSLVSPTKEALREKRDEILSRSELKEIDAVRNGKVYVSHLSLRRGPRLVGYLLYLARWFHPDLFEDVDPATVERELLQKFYGIDLEGTWTYPEV